MKRFLIIILLASVTFGQSLRSLINDGAEEYEKGNYAQAEILFKKALDLDFKSYEAHYNLANTYYKQKKFADALKEYKTALKLLKSEDKDKRSDIFYNVGNVFLKSDSLDQAINAYIASLQENPKDMDAKYNLSYALKKKQQQQKQQNKNQNKNNKNKKNDKQNKDKNKNKDKDKNKDKKNKNDKNKNDKNKNKNDNKNNRNNRDKQKQKDKQKQQQQNQRQKKEEISKQDAARILAALKNNEKKLQKKLRKQKGKAVRTEKDW